MRRFTLISALMVLAAVTVVSTASAQHFTRKGAPTCTDIGTQLQCTAELAGLGNEDLRMDLSSEGFVTAFCVSPGGNESPGQNKTPATTLGGATISAGEIKNGRARITGTTEAPGAPTAREAGCPNRNWSTRLAGVEFTNITVTISQGGDVLFICTREGAGTQDNQTVPLTCQAA